MQPETIEVTKLPFVLFEQKKSLPSLSGIYFVCNQNNDIKYIGLSVNIRSRWLNHHREEDAKNISGCRIHYLLVTDTSLLNGIELALINYFKPPLNKQFYSNSVARVKRNKKNAANIMFQPSYEEKERLDAYCTAVGRTKTAVLRELIRNLPDYRTEATQTTSEETVEHD